MPGRGAAVAAVLLGALLWGTTGTAQELGGLDAPAAVGAARLAGGGAALAAILLLGGRLPEVRALLRRESLRWVLLAAAGVSTLQLAFFPAVATTGVAVGTVVAIGLSPVLTGLLAALLLRERFTRGWATATALAVSGCVVLVLGGNGGGEDGPGVSVAGVALAALAGSGYALYTVAAKSLLSSGAEPLAVLTTTLGLGALVCAPVLVATGRPLASADAVPALLWLCLAATALAYVVYARGLRALGAGTVGTLSLAEPLLAAALGLLLLDERPSPLSLAGGAVLLLGLAVAAAPGRPATSAGPSPGPGRTVSHARG